MRFYSKLLWAFGIVLFVYVVFGLYTICQIESLTNEFHVLADDSLFEYQALQEYASGVHVISSGVQSYLSGDENEGRQELLYGQKLIAKSKVDLLQSGDGRYDELFLKDVSFLNATNQFFVACNNDLPCKEQRFYYFDRVLDSLMQELDYQRMISKKIIYDDIHDFSVISNRITWTVAFGFLLFLFAVLLFVIKTAHKLTAPLERLKQVSKDISKGHYDLTLAEQDEDLADFSSLLNTMLSKINKTLEALKESKEQYQDLFENANDLIQSVDMSGKFVYVNKAWRDTLGYSLSEVKTMTIFDVIAKKHIASCKKIFRGIQKKGSCDSFIDTVFVTKSEEEVAVQGNVNCIVNSGHVIATRAIFRNVTEQKYAEQSLMEVHKELIAEQNLFVSGKVVVFKWQFKKGWPVEFVSQNVLDVLGYTKEDLLTGSVIYADLIHPNDLQKIKKEVEQNIKQKQSFFSHSDYRLQKKDGTYMWVYDFTTIIRNKKGRVTHFLGYIIDVSERVEKERLIEKTLSFQKTLTKVASSFLETKHFDRTLQRNILKINNFLNTDALFLYEIEKGTFVKRVSWTHSSLNIKTSFFKTALIPKDCVLCNTSAGKIRRLDKSNAFYVSDVGETVAICLKTKQGRWGILGAYFKQRVKKEDLDMLEVFAHVLATAIERHQFLHQLTESEKKFKDTVNLVPNIIAELDTKGNLVFFNELAKKKLGYTDKDIMGKNAIMLLYQGDRKEASRRIAESLQGKRLDPQEYRLYTKKGGLVDVIIHSAPIFTPHGSIGGIRLSITDIGDLKRAQRKLTSFNRNLEKTVEKRTAELTKAFKKLEELDSMKDNFLSNISHELRTPLTSIKSFNQILYQGRLGSVTDDQKEALGIVLDSTNHLVTLIDSILDVSRYEAGRATLHFEPITLFEIVQSVVTELSSMIVDVGTISVRGSKTKVITGDADKLRQVFINLIGNSYKYRSEHRRLKISVRIFVETKNLVVEIKDNGIGISKENLKEIFNKFYQVDQSLIRKRGGAGLGLSIVQNIVKLHRGKITVDSVVGKSTVVRVSLPLNK